MAETGSGVVRGGLSQQVARELGVRIMRGDIAPGQALPIEPVLGRELAVSRTALREGIKLLIAKGLIESRPKSGTRVCPRGHWSLLDPDVLCWLLEARPSDSYLDSLFEARRTIEPAAAAIAAARGDAEAIGRIECAYAEMVRAGDDFEAGVEPDLRFHQAVLDATRNEFLIPLGALIRSALAIAVRIAGAVPGGILNSLPAHHAVLAAIQRGDPAEARRAMEDLLSSAMLAIRRIAAEAATGDRS